MIAPFWMKRSTGSWRIDDKTHTARVLEGDYSAYVATVRSELDKQWAQWRDQQVEIARLEADMRRTMAKAVRKENATKDPRSAAMRKRSLNAPKRKKSG